MKRKISKDQLVNYIKQLDKRADKMSAEAIDEVILQGFTELSTVVYPFTEEQIIDITPFIEAGEDKITVDIDLDVVEIYDLYIVTETETDGTVKEQGTYVARDDTENPKFLYEDNRYTGRYHIIVEELPASAINAVAKFFYIPGPDFVDAYVDGQTELALKNACASSLYDVLHDVERSSQKRAAMIRTASLIADSGKPRDWVYDSKPSMFPR